jgi:hypothetical protein
MPELHVLLPELQQANRDHRAADETDEQFQHDLKTL